MPKVNDNSRYLCMANEGFAPEPYYCPAKVLTQGFGHTNMAAPPSIAIVGGKTWTIEEAYEIFKRTYERYADRTRRQLGEETFNRLSDNQFGALVSFVYNVGSLTLKDGRPSGLLRAVRDQRYDDVPRELDKWTQAKGQVMPGLVRRRKAEALLFAGDSRAALAMAGPIPLVNSKGRVVGTVRAPAFGTVKSPAFGKPPAIASETTPPAAREGELVVPTATQPNAPAEVHAQINKNASGRMTGAVATGGGSTAVTAAYDWRVAVGVGAVTFVGVGALVWHLTREHNQADADHAA